jgi:SAM-dependent methyltransferase
MDWYKEPEASDYDSDFAYWQNHGTSSRIMRAIAIINSLENCNSILDVGCGPAGLLMWMKSEYIHKVATDICQRAYLGGIEKRPEIAFEVGDFLDIPFMQFDVVVCLEVMEHIEPSKREAFAAKLLKIARKHLIVSIPYMWQGSKEPVPHDGYSEKDLLCWFKHEGDFTMERVGAHLIAHYRMEVSK